MTDYPSLDVLKTEAARRLDQVEERLHSLSSLIYGDGELVLGCGTLSIEDSKRLGLLVRDLGRVHSKLESYQDENSTVRYCAVVNGVEVEV